MTSVTSATCISLILAAQVALGGLEKYSTLVVADKIPNAPVSANAIRVTYLGVNGFQFETAGHTLLVDPYFTRVGFWPAALNRPIKADDRAIDEGLTHVRPKADAILVTHAHFDHLLDVAQIMHQTHALLLSGATAVRLTESMGRLPNECETVQPGSSRQVGPWRIRVLAANHDRIFGKIPFQQCHEPAIDGKKASKPSDWCLGEPLAFLIEAAGKKIYIDSGGVPGSPFSSAIGHVDLAILGVALPDSRQRFAEVVRRLQPRYTLPSHQDDMFASFSRGFVFGKMTNFPEIVRECEKERLPGRLILLDYFRPWTLR